MGQIASGQITITDLNDGRTFITQITDSLNSGGYFSYDPDNALYSPNLTSGVTLTASLYTTTSATNLLPNGNSDITVSEIQWYRAGVAITNANSNVITLTESSIFPNKESVNSVNYTIKFKIKENIFGITAPSIPMEQSFTINRVKQGSSANYVLLQASPSNTFVNAAGSDQIIITAKPYSNGVLLESTVSNPKYWKWEYYDDTTSSFKEINASSYPNSTWNTLTVTDNEIFGSEVFRYSYDFSGGESFDTSKAISQSIVIIDYTDPITVTVTSNAGDVFKPGMGEKTLVANVYEKIEDRHELVDDPNVKYNFTWAAFNKDGVAVTENGFTTVAGKPNQIKVSTSQVTVAGTFIVSVEEKVSAAQKAYSETYGFRAYIL